MGPLLGARTLLGAPGLATRNKKLLGAPGIATRSKDACASSTLTIASDGANRRTFHKVVTSNM